MNRHGEMGNMNLQEEGKILTILIGVETKYWNWSAIFTIDVPSAVDLNIRERSSGDLGLLPYSC